MTTFQKYLKALSTKEAITRFNVCERTIRYWRAGTPPPPGKLPMIRRKTGFSATEIYG